MRPLGLPMFTDSLSQALGHMRHTKSGSGPTTASADHERLSPRWELHRNRLAGRGLNICPGDKHLDCASAVSWMNTSVFVTVGKSCILSNLFS